jgi:hypothetical protein
MFSETRYALNGDLRVAYRTSREGPRVRGAHELKGVPGEWRLFAVASA